MSYKDIIDDSLLTANQKTATLLLEAADLIQSDIKKTKKVQRWNEEELKKGNLSADEIRRLENAREKTLLKKIISKDSLESKMLRYVDVIMDNVKLEHKKVKIMSLYTEQSTNEIIRLNTIYDNIKDAMNSDDKITVIHFHGKNIISDGNHRVNALLKMGIDSVVVKYYDYDANPVKLPI